MHGLITFIANLLLFLMAYVPLIFMFAALVFPDSAVLSLILVAAGVGIALLGRFSLGMSTKRSMTTSEVVSITNNGGASMAYLATYILPFVSGVPESLSHGIAAAIYLATLFVIFSQTDVRSVNPTLFMFGIKVARIRLDNDESPVDAICMTSIIAGDHVSQTTFGGAKIVKRIVPSRQK